MPAQSFSTEYMSTMSDIFRMASDIDSSVGTNLRDTIDHLLYSGVLDEGDVYDVRAGLRYIAYALRNV